MVENSNGAVRAPSCNMYIRVHYVQLSVSFPSLFIYYYSSIYTLPLITTESFAGPTQ